jgi:predicted transcriptional regulator
VDEKKAMTVRLDSEQAEELEAIARVEGMPVSEEVREAIAAHIAAKKKDDAFRQRLKESIERNREILERLAD